jgi:hypothetical protein
MRWHETELCIQFASMKDVTLFSELKYEEFLLYITIFEWLMVLTCRCLKNVVYVNINTVSLM